MRPRFSSFRKSHKEWCLLIDGKEPSTNKTHNKLPNHYGARVEWWYEADKIHDSETTRNLAYLVTYLEVFGPRLSMKGLGVLEGWVYPDRAIMRSLHADEVLADDGTAFVLTPKGHALIAPWLVQDGTTFCRVTGTEQKA
ncbi:MAG: hypothetical protein U1A24_09740 [Cypionkella sp.]|uniref:hypothetical protein n=1 Tax=Cypionkella sp. TaxID=2811411 RepID=UPI002ABB8491|nr:hypothetical protein [Cypionkella sp.]MDZ4310821.1 hypothetical protein [Cypionkella sp.]